ncbi:MAG: toll/interleukin-1 receptor domain-containing protein [Deltaproteobacteria bacterium]|nr:toll/interleukin-1 receptor domain-containing protein [Deltaproteobacteria bacterium]
MDDQYDVFLCHNSQDKPVVRELAKSLQARGLKVWLDEWELIPGRRWQDALEEVIEEGHVRTAAVLVGPDGFGPWQNMELRVFLDEFVRCDLPVIPVLLPEAPSGIRLPLFLRGFTWVDLRKGFSEKDLDRLIWGITGTKPEPPPLSIAEKLSRLVREIQDKDQSAKPVRTEADDSKAIAPQDQAKQALGKDDFDQVRGLLNQTGDTALTEAEENPETAEVQSLSAAASRAKAGGQEMTKLAYAAAADYYGQAAALVPAGSELVKAYYVNQQGRAFYNAGKYADAEAPFKWALGIRERLLVPSDPEIVVSLNNLANSYRRQKKYDQAEPLYKRAFEIRGEALGPEHLDTVQIMNNLAMLYNAQKKYAKAEQLLKQVLRIREKVLGQKHPKTAKVRNNIAKVHSSMVMASRSQPRRKIMKWLLEGGIAAALIGVAFTQFVPWSRITPGSKPPETKVFIGGNVTAGGHANIGSGTITIYDLPKEQYDKKSVELGVTQAALENFFKIMEQKQVPREKLDQTLRELAERYKKLQQELAAFKSDDSDVKAITNQAKQALEQGDFDRANRIYEDAAKKATDKANLLHLSAAASKANAGDLKVTQSAYAAAADYYGQAAGLIPAGSDLIKAGYMYQQGTALYKAGKYAEAEAPLKDALGIRERLLEPNDYNMVTTLYSLANLYMAQKKYDQAEPLYKRALEIREKTPGPTHPDTAAVRNSLSELKELIAKAKK